MANVESDDPVIPPSQAHFSSIKPSPRTDTAGHLKSHRTLDAYPSKLPHYATLITTYQYSMNKIL